MAAVRLLNEEALRRSLPGLYPASFNRPLTMPVLNEPCAGQIVAKRRGEIDMGTIIEFPADAASRRLLGTMNVAPRETTATILILPAVRIERHTDETNGGSGPEEGTAPGRRRRRRARS